jgi:SAM-dependent methyltransferase
MAHYQQQRFAEIVAGKLAQFFRGTRVLEVGSWNATGTVRDRFTDCDYTGVDVAPGPCVDRVCPGQDLDYPDGHFDVVISMECFEHNPAWRETFRNMVRMLRPGGLCIVTCACIGRGEHGTSRRAAHSSLTVLTGSEHYTNLRKSDLAAAVDLRGVFGDAWGLFYNMYFYDLYFVGLKRPAEGSLPEDLVREVRAITEEKPPALGRRLNVFATFWLTYAFASLLGERRYHDFKFSARRALRRIGSTR